MLTTYSPPAPWEDMSLLFLVPGIVGWLIAVVWALRDRNSVWALGLQFIFTLEIALGAVAASGLLISMASERCTEFARMPQ